MLLVPGIALGGYTDCLDNWKVTGYHTAHESDYSSSNKVCVYPVDGDQACINKEFKEMCRLEASCVLNDGRILEYWDGNWHIGPFSRDAQGQELITYSSAAVDTGVLDFGVKFIVQGLPEYLGLEGNVWTAQDVGESVQGRWVDLFMGFGDAAKYETWDVSKDNQNCLFLEESTTIPDPEPEPPIIEVPECPVCDLCEVCEVCTTPDNSNLINQIDDLIQELEDIKAQL